MTPQRRPQRLVRTANGSLIDELALKALVDGWVRDAPAPVRVRRLSTRPGPDQLPTVEGRR